MIVEYIRYDTRDDARALIEAYKQAAPHLEAAPECLRFELAQGIEAPTMVTVRIEWTSVHDHEQGFRRGPHFPPFLQLVRPFMPLILEMKHYQPLTVSDGKGRNP